MKKLAFLAAFFLFQFANAQSSGAGGDSTPIELRKNEVKLDVVALIAMTKLHVSYERFLNNDFSVGISGALWENNKNEEEFEKGHKETLPRYEITPFVRYALSKSAVSYYFVEGFVSLNGGKYRELKRFSEGGYGYWDAPEDHYTDMAIGGAAGYKLYIKEKFGIELFVGVGRNILNMDVSPTYVHRVGVNFGYRF